MNQYVNQKIKIVAEPSDAGTRLDHFLSARLGDNATRSFIQRLISSGMVTCHAAPLKKSYKLNGSEEIMVQMPKVQDSGVFPENIPLEIIHEDNFLLVINKKRGMVVHPAAGNRTGTLVNALLHHCGNKLSDFNGEDRPGIVHRIDKDTSGLLVVAKDNSTHKNLAAQIAEHTVQREYEAIVFGNIQSDAGTIDLPIARHKIDRKKMAVVDGGRRAITHYHVIKRYHSYTHVGFSLKTGRTHQIRVHMAHCGHPIIGDPVYGMKKDRFANLGGQCLHAIRLKFLHPYSMRNLTFFAPIPKYFNDVLSKLEKMQ